MRAGGGATDAEFTAFVAARWSSLLRTAYLLTGSTAAAEDLVQAALAKTYVAWPRLRDIRAAEPYVKRTMVTTYTSWWRKHRGRETSTADIGEHVAGARPSADVDALVARSVFWPHLQRLPRGQRSVIVLRYYEDLTEVETARLMGCSVGTVKSQAHRGLATLRAALTDESATTTVKGA